MTGRIFVVSTDDLATIGSCANFPQMSGLIAGADKKMSRDENDSLGFMMDRNASMSLKP